MKENQNESKTPLDKVIAVFGSASAVAKALDMNRSNINHWETRHKGLIPSKYHKPLLDAAKQKGLELNPVDLIEC